MIVVQRKNWITGIREKLATWSMMLALFFNPFGFDIVQYQLICLTGDLWKANLVLYFISAFFFGLSFFYQKYFDN